jgi:putative FmdB family regulatory protein
MPIYEYQCENPKHACEKCIDTFEIIQELTDAPLPECPWCGRKVRKLISACRIAIVETPEIHTDTEKRIREYEKQAMWSHAAELADKHAEKIKDAGMKLRAMDNYEKAGYDPETLERHTKSDNS